MNCFYFHKQMNILNARDELWDVMYFPYQSFKQFVMVIKISLCINKFNCKMAVNNIIWIAFKHEYNVHSHFVINLKDSL